VVLALSTAGGAEGERALPLVSDDEDWDAVGDRIYALVPELDHAELAAVLRAVRTALRAVRDDWSAAGEARVLARVALERTASVWESAGAPVLLDCVDAWLKLSEGLDPRVWPTFLAGTWAELRPASLPDPRDLAEVQRFTDWVTLCELLGEFSSELLDQLGHDAAQTALIRRFREGAYAGGSEGLTWSAEAPTLHEDDRTRQVAGDVVRRVLVDL
jgi:hypothetical protein